MKKRTLTLSLIFLFVMTLGGCDVWKQEEAISNQKQHLKRFAQLVENINTNYELIPDEQKDKIDVFFDKVTVKLKKGEHIPETQVVEFWDNILLIYGKKNLVELAHIYEEVVEENPQISRMGDVEKNTFFTKYFEIDKDSKLKTVDNDCLKYLGAGVIAALGHGLIDFIKCTSMTAGVGVKACAISAGITASWTTVMSLVVYVACEYSE